MIVFIILQILILGICFGFWYLEPEYMSQGYLIYHLYPLILIIVALLSIKKVAHTSSVMKILGLLLPFSLWVAGVWYIFIN